MFSFAQFRQRGSAMTGLVLLVVIIVIGLLGLYSVRSLIKKQTTPTPGTTKKGNLSLADFDLKIQDMLRVTVAYNSTLSQGFQILTVEKKQGFVKKPTPRRLHFTLQLLDAAGEVLTTQPFVPADEIDQDGYSIAGAANAQTKFTHAVTFSLTIPWQDGGKSLRIIAPNGLPLLTRPLKSNEVRLSVPDLAAAILSDLAQTPSVILKPAYAAAPPQHRKLTIAFIPAGYGDMEKDSDAQKRFNKDMTTYLANTKQIEPFKSRWDRDINAIVYDKTNFNFCLELKDGSRTSQAVEDSCSFNKIDDQLTQLGIYPDLIVVLADYKEMTDFSFVNLEDGHVVIANTVGHHTPGVLAHELGHAIGKLFDERDSNGPTDLVTNEMYENCFAGSSPDWHGLDSNPQNTGGCVFGNWTASQPHSLMAFNGKTEDFNPVSLFFMNAWLDYYTGRSNVPELAIKRMDLGIRINYHSPQIPVDGCPSEPAISANRQTTPESCQYLHPTFDIHNPNLTQTQIAQFTVLYRPIFVSGGVGSSDEFDKRLQFILDRAKEANITPLLALGLWKSEANFGVDSINSKYKTDLGCEVGNPSDAPDFYSQVLCVYGLKDTANFGPNADYTNPTGFAIPACIKGNQQACDALQEIRTKTQKNPPTYSNLEKFVNDPIILPFINFDDVFEVYGPRSPILNDDGSANYNCVHSYNDALEVARQLNMCGKPSGDLKYAGFDEGGTIIGGGQQSHNCPSVTNSICGYVKDNTGIAIGNVTVGANCNMPCTAVNAQTGSDGYYEFTNLPATVYDIGIGPNNMPQGYTKQSGPVFINVPTANHQIDITVSP